MDGKLRRKQTAAYIMLASSLFLLTGCKVRKLQNEYDMMVRNHASKAEICAQARRITQAALESGSEKLYSDKKLQSDIDCGLAAVAVSE